MRRLQQKLRCVRCGAIFYDPIKFEKHLESCNANPMVGRSKMIDQRLKEVAEELKLGEESLGS